MVEGLYESVVSERLLKRLDARTDLLRQIAAVEKGFPILPSGCEIVLDEVTQASVLAGIRAHLRLRWTQLVRELRAHPTDSLPQFLDDSGADLAQVVRRGRSWTQLRRDAGLLVGTSSAVESGLLKRVRALAHVDDRARALAYRRLLSESPDAAGAADHPFARMLF